MHAACLINIDHHIISKFLFLVEFWILKIFLTILFKHICLFCQVWSHNMPDNSVEVAHKTFLELEQHKAMIEETKTSILNYTAKSDDRQDFDVKDLLAQGEKTAPQLHGSLEKKKKKSKRAKDDSESDMDDWEEVKGIKCIVTSMTFVFYYLVLNKPSNTRASMTAL